MPHATAVFWFRRDLRLHDNAGLYHALQSGLPVMPVFIFDTDILEQLDDKHDRRMVFIHQQLVKLNNELQKFGSRLHVYHGKPIEVWRKICAEIPVAEVFTNHDYEPYARKRDAEIEAYLKGLSVGFHTYKDQVIFEKNEVAKEDGTAYAVFTPYMKRWRAIVTDQDLQSFATENYFGNFMQTDSHPVLSLEQIGFDNFPVEFPSPQLREEVIRQYAENRDFPGIDGTSRLSVHMRFGTVSMRELFRFAWNISEKWTNELIWREFYMQILWHFPHVVKGAFKPQYDFLKWKNDEKEFDKWCKGETGYPIVDAGMRELNETGYMHNRVRMITAMFLTKYLLIDWRWGEAYFAQKLLDFELSSNNGGWQWSAGTGVDAAPYFRVFSMDEQTRRFDPDFKYIKKWVPEFQEFNYPRPVVDYAFARKRCLDFYQSVLKS
ncbi:MAG TPA: deoxyribodipyrimidine photo-lyase [Bacteroidia bacterium]|nr:deoxyribodipyrimidine photo-lyase [Bacteroidia bacterium]